MSQEFDVAPVAGDGIEGSQRLIDVHVEAAQRGNPGGTQMTAPEPSPKGGMSKAIRPPIG